MIGIAAGLASSGKIPFASTFAVFAPGRCFDQIRMSVAYSKLNVKLIATHGGISVGEDGASHQSIEDLSLFCSLPGFTVIVPADCIETAQAVRAAAANYGPFYIRLCRPNLPLVYDEAYHFQLGKAVMMRQGNDITIIATGIMVLAALEAADNLKGGGIDCRVLNMPTIKPMLDKGFVFRDGRVEFVDRFKNIENEITLLKESQKELLEEYSDRLDVKTLQAAMRTVKIKKKVSYKDTFDTFVDILEEKESI
jgi:transketolase